ncbi:MAG: divalent-cation tolerance protein CutA [Myxococcales bacterium]|nr:divalent-cation tolerance protein CutA [Myxococcales bacterium]
MLVVLCTVPADGDHAARIARGLIEARLAACVNTIGPVRSTYRWQGAVEEASELQLVIKTTACRYDALEGWLRAHHPYSEPEIIAIAVTRGSASYLAWVEGATREDTPGTEDLRTEPSIREGSCTSIAPPRDGPC